jgi:hypothetical protein
MNSGWDLRPEDIGKMMDALQNDFEGKPKAYISASFMLSLDTIQSLIERNTAAIEAQNRTIRFQNWLIGIFGLLFGSFLLLITLAALGI